MKNRTIPTQSDTTVETTNYLFWITVVQGIAFVILGILVLVYPLFLFPIVAFTFILSGISAMLLGFRIRQYGRDSFYGRDLRDLERRAATM